MRVFLGMTEVAGFCANLKKGFNDIGVACTFVALTSHRYAYGREDTNIVVRLAQTTCRRLGRPGQSLGTKLVWRIAHHLSLWLLLFWAVATHDTFIFVAGGSVLGLRDLPILKLLRKRIVFVFLGSDSRPPFCDGGAIRIGDAPVGERCARASRERKALLQRIDNFATVVIDHPLASHFHTRTLIKFSSIGLPYEIDIGDRAGRREEYEDSERALRILHAPSDPERKGTARIREIVRQVALAGNAIDYVEVTGVPNRELLKEIARCDLVVDQMFSDTPLAGLGTQAAFLGKPTVLGGYGQEDLRRFYTEEEIPPSFYCRPEEMEATLSAVVRDAALRRTMGRRAQAYVERNCTPSVVAARYLRLLEGDVPAEWKFEPTDVRYLNGWGIDEQDVAFVLRAMLEFGGRESLQLGDKPELEEAFVRFANEARSV